PRAGVVVELDHEVVEAILPPQPVAGFRGGPPEWSIVAPVGGIFAPGEVGRDTLRGQQRARPRVAVGPPPQANEAVPPARGGAGAFVFVGADAAPSEHHRDGLRTREQDAPGRLRRPRANADEGERMAAQGACLHDRTVSSKWQTRLLFY